MLDFLSRRRRQSEWMDEPGVDPEELRRSLRFIQWINAWLGYTRATLGHLEKFAAGWKAGETITIADFATGSADVPVAVAKWAKSRGHRVRMVGLELHAATAAAAREAVGECRGGGDEGGANQVGGNGIGGAETVGSVHIVRADALRSPLADRGVDYAMASMFLHHLSDEDAARLLAEMDRVSRRGMIVADLLRSRRAYAWIRLFTLAASPIVRHDAAVSVAQAFTRREVEQLRERAGLGYLWFVEHFGHRFALVGEKIDGGNGRSGGVAGVGAASRAARFSSEA
jgi:hypothetical protein